MTTATAKITRWCLLIPALVSLLWVLAIAIQLVHYYPQLRARPVSHLGRFGEPDGWMNKRSFATIERAVHNQSDRSAAG